MCKVKADLVVIKNKNSKMVAEFLFFGAGSKNDPKDLQGLSHFLEHVIASQGLKKIMKIRYLGGERRAQTSNDFIRIYHYIPNEVWKESLYYLLDYLYKTEITEEKVEAQKRIISEEIKHWETFGLTQITRNLFKLCFSSHPYSNNTTGFVNHIQKITKSVLEQYRESFWGDILILIVGDVEKREVEYEINKYLKDIDIRISEWNIKRKGLPPNGLYTKSVKTDIKNFLGIGLIKKKPMIEEIASFYIISSLLLFEDPTIIEILRDAKIQTVSIKTSISKLFLRDISLLYLIVFLEKQIYSVNFDALWHKIARNFNLLKGKVLLYEEISSILETSSIMGYFYFNKKDYNEFKNILKRLDNNTFLNSMKNIDRICLLYPKEEEK